MKCFSAVQPLLCKDIVVFNMYNSAKGNSIYKRYSGVKGNSTCNRSVKK